MIRRQLHFVCSQKDTPLIYDLGLLLDGAVIDLCYQQSEDNKFDPNII